MLWKEDYRRCIRVTAVALFLYILYLLCLKKEVYQDIIRIDE